jgi:hypothetical protein
MFVARLVDIGVLQEDYSSKWVSPTSAIPKKNGIIRVITDFRELNLLLKHQMPPVSHSKDWGHDPLNESIYFCYSIGLEYMGSYDIKLDVDAQKLCTIVISMGSETIQIQKLTYPSGVSRFPSF